MASQGEKKPCHPVSKRKGSQSQARGGGFETEALISRNFLQTGETPGNVSNEGVGTFFLFHKELAAKGQSVRGGNPPKKFFPGHLLILVSKKGGKKGPVSKKRRKGVNTISSPGRFPQKKSLRIEKNWKGRN